MNTKSTNHSNQHAALSGATMLTIARHYSCGAVAVHVADCGGSFDLYAGESCEEYLGNVCSLTEGERFLQER